jgi:hypothetical protein
VLRERLLWRGIWPCNRSVRNVHHRAKTKSSELA